MKLRIFATVALSLSAMLPTTASAASYIKVRLEGMDPLNGTIISGAMALAQTGFILGEVPEDDVTIYSHVFGSLKIGDVIFSDSSVIGFYPVFFEFREIRGSADNSHFSLIAPLRGNSFGIRSSFSYSLDGGPNRTTPSGTFTTFRVVDSAVPEPTTWAMMFIGFGTIGVGIRANRRKQAALAAA